MRKVYSHAESNGIGLSPGEYTSKKAAYCIRKLVSWAKRDANMTFQMSRLYMYLQHFDNDIRIESLVQRQNDGKTSYYHGRKDVDFSSMVIVAATYIHNNNNRSINSINPTECRTRNHALLYGCQQYLAKKADGLSRRCPYTRIEPRYMGLNGIIINREMN